ncbi:hypothetical protein B296_00032865 [Ensete ventricosum]|uniref:Uncharacterized protein n=1 Tax=Ensete ventricosum TaxID=4639 RepID=A0A426ZBC7_ENSVE|nr:hypothetical protein B296_00032865 [Ensete ventricosum]
MRQGVASFSLLPAQGDEVLPRSRTVRRDVTSFPHEETRCRLVLPSTHAGRQGVALFSLLIIPSHFSPRLPARGEGSPSAKNRPGNRGRAGISLFSPFLLLPLLLSPSIDHRRSQSIADVRFRWYRPIADGPRTGPTRRYRTKRKTLLVTN